MVHCFRVELHVTKYSTHELTACVLVRDLQMGRRPVIERAILCDMLC